MSVWTTPATRSLGFLVTPAVWNADIVNNLIYLKTAPVFDTAVIIGAATTAGVRLDLESGTLAVREGDDSAYAPLIASVVNLPSGGSINFASGDVTITHSTDALAFAGAANGYTFANGPLRPATNDGAALGTTTTQWSDLFLASGAVINFDNGDITVTHSANTLTFAGASSGYVFDDHLKLTVGKYLDWGTTVGSFGGRFGRYVTGSFLIGVPGTSASETFLITDSAGADIAEFRGDKVTRLAGNLGIGTSPSYRLDVTGAAGSVVARFNQATAGKTGIFLAENGSTRGYFSQVGLYSGTSDGNVGIFVETGYDFQVATNGSATTKFRVGTGGNIGINATARLYLDGSAGTGDTYLVESSNNQVQLVVGLQRKIFAGYQTQSVGTTATTILADAEFFGSLVVVTGNEFLTSNSFCDVVMASRNVAPTVVVTYNSNGSPTARTYSRSGNALQLAMAANTYLVSTTALS